MTVPLLLSSIRKNNLRQKYFPFFLFCILFFFCQSFSSPFLTEEKKPTEQLVALLKIDGLYDPNDTLAKIVEKTQKSWLQVVFGQGGRERIDLIDTEKMILQRTEIVAIARSMGLFSAKKPLFTHYDYAICYGGFLTGVKSHLLELMRLWKEGVHFDALFFFGSERPLRKEEMETLGFSCTTEYEMLPIVWDQTEVPKDMREALKGKIFFQKTSHKKFPRASLKEHYESWLSLWHPKKGTILAVSYPLCWCYQQWAAENILPEGFILDTVAPELSEADYKMQEKAIVSQIHDAIAKALFEMAQKK